MQRSINIALTLALLACAGCVDFNANRVIEVKSTGTVVGLAFLDRNGNGTMDATVDAAVPNVAVRVVPAGAATPAARVISTSNGLLLMLPARNHIEGTSEIAMAERVAKAVRPIPRYRTRTPPARRLRHAPAISPDAGTVGPRYVESVLG